MPYWDCPRCATENSLGSNSCWRCGYHYFPGPESAAPSHDGPQHVRDLLEKERKGIREEIEKNLKRHGER